MMALINNSGHREQNQKPARKRICSKLLVLVGLGMMVLAVCSLLPGCGSDRTSESNKGKKDQTRVLGKKSPSVVRPLLTDQTKTTSEKVGEVREIMPGITQDQFAARLAEERKKLKAQKPREVLPGLRVNEEDVMSKIAAERKKLEARKSVEVLPGIPGITQEELNTMIGKGRRTTNTEVLPGVTQVEIDTRIDAEQRKHRTQN
jgi:hypothetical protein